jgi:hypothetical protein
MKNFSNTKFNPEVNEKIVEKLHSLAKFAILETFEPDYYGTAKDHALAGLEKHKEIYGKYPEYYVDLFTTEELCKRFLDAHIIIASMFLLDRGVDLEIILENLKKVQINRAFLFFTNALNSQVITGGALPKSEVRGLFYEFLSRIEEQKGKDYTAFFAVKYRNKLQALFASLRIKRKKLSPLWQELMDFLFINKTKRHAFTIAALQWIVNVRNLRNTDAVKKANKVPFTTVIGYAWKIMKAEGYTAEEIKKWLMSRTDLMSNTEVKRAVRQIEESGQLKTEAQKKKVAARVKRAPGDVFGLLNMLFAAPPETYAITLEAIEEKTKKVIKELEKTFKNKKVAVGVDVSGNTVGAVRRVAGKELVMRRTYDKNILTSFVLSEISKEGKVLFFNETTEEIEFGELKELLGELQVFKPDGGSAPYYALKKLIETSPDAIVMISDFNENIPIRGMLAMKIAELAKSFKKPIFLLQTELDITELTALEKVIFDEKLTNVYLIPIKRLEHLKQVLETIEFDERIKELIIKIVRQRPDVEVYA